LRNTSDCHPTTPCVIRRICCVPDDMPRTAPLLLLGCLLAEATAQAFAPVGRPFDVGISSAYDTVRRRLVLFGDDGTTWELDGG
jgi:hypothetical protein